MCLLASHLNAHTLHSLDGGSHLLALSSISIVWVALCTISTASMYNWDLCLFLSHVIWLSIQEKRRLAIRNAAQQWEGLKSCLDLPTQNGSKEEVSPENSPTHSSEQTNGIAQDPSPDEPRYRCADMPHVSPCDVVMCW